MPNDLINIIINDSEALAQYIETVRTLAGTSQWAREGIQKYFGPTLEKNFRAILSKARELRDNVSPGRQTDPSPSVVIPLVDAACQESREELQELWAALLANSMIDDGKTVRRSYIDVMKRLEPADVAVLNVLRLPLPVTANSNHPNAWFRFHADKQHEIGLSPDEWLESVKMLTDLGLAYQHNNQVGTTPLARRFLAACHVA